MTPRQLASQMVATADPDNDLFASNAQRIVVMAWAEMVLAIAEERDAAVARAQSSGQAEATLRGAATALIAAADEVLREHGQEAHIWRLSVHAAKLDAALAAPPTTYAKLAAAKDEVIAAGRAAHDSTTCLRPGCTIRHTPRPRHLDELWRVLDALAAAEAEAGVGADG